MRIRNVFHWIREMTAARPKIGMAWYQEDQWPLLRELSVDKNRLEEKYTEWLALAQAKYAQLLQSGKPVVKVPVDVKDMATWCAELGQKVDGDGRVAYVVFVLEKQKRTIPIKKVRN